MENNNDNSNNSVTSIEIMPKNTLTGSGHYSQVGINTIQSTAQNTLSPINNFGYLYPYYYQYAHAPWITINKAENGYILLKEGKTFVCKKVEDLVKLLEEVKK